MSPTVDALNTNASQQLTEIDPKPRLILPKWFNQHRFDLSRTVIYDNLLAIFFNHLAGLVLLVFIKAIYKTLYLTGKSKNYTTTFYRYMRTVIKVKLWYEGKVYKPNDPAAMAVLEVKRMHQQASFTQNKDRKLGEELAISQRDMVLTQFAFIGLIVLHPNKFGIHRDVPETLDRLIYFWRVIGSLLGIKDEHNLCNGTVSDVKQRCQDIFDECFFPALKKLNPERFEMCKHILTGTQEYVYFTRFRSTLLYLFQTLDIKHDDIFKNFTFMESLCYYSLRYTMAHGLRFVFIRFLLNQLFSLAIWRLGHKSFVESIVKKLNLLDAKS